MSWRKRVRYGGVHFLYFFNQLSCWEWLFPFNSLKGKTSQSVSHKATPFSFPPHLTSRTALPPGSSPLQPNPGWQGCVTWHSKWHGDLLATIWMYNRLEVERQTQVVLRTTSSRKKKQIKKKLNNKTETPQKTALFHVVNRKTLTKFAFSPAKVLKKLKRHLISHVHCTLVFVCHFSLVLDNSYWLLIEFIVFVTISGINFFFFFFY